MRLVTIDSQDGAGRPGVLLSDERILDLAAAPNTLAEARWVPQSVVSVLAAGDDGLARLAGIVANVESADAERRQSLTEGRVLLPYATTALLPPVRRPGLILLADAEQSWIKNPNSAVGVGANISVPDWLEDRDINAHCILAAVLGRSLYRAEPSTVARAIAAYTIVLDLAPPAPEDRTFWPSWLSDQQFPGACTIGPALVTADEMTPLASTRYRVAINDVTLAEGSPVDADDAFEARISELSFRYTLRAGDLIGLRSADDALRFNLRRGDSIAIDCDDAMRLTVSLNR